MLTSCILLKTIFDHFSFGINERKNIQIVKEKDFNKHGVVKLN